MKTNLNVKLNNDIFKNEKKGKKEKNKEKLLKNRK